MLKIWIGCDGVAWIGFIWFEMRTSDRAVVIMVINIRLSDELLGFSSRTLFLELLR
jgi:hypothetical protein